MSNLQELAEYILRLETERDDALQQLAMANDYIEQNTQQQYQ